MVDIREGWVAYHLTQVCPTKPMAKNSHQLTTCFPGMATCSNDQLPLQTVGRKTYYIEIQVET